MAKAIQEAVAGLVLKEDIIGGFCAFFQVCFS